MFMPMQDDLPERVTQAIYRAQQAGALRELPTVATLQIVNGLAFVIHKIAHLKNKPRSVAQQASPSVNPFLPYDPHTYVADVPPHHVCLLNKYYVVARHLLIVTRHFEPQESPLTADDFHAWWSCLVQFPSLGFYNGGPVAGASQPHKHAQLIPWPLCRPPQGTLLTDVYQRVARDGEVTAAPDLPFRHAVCGWQEQAWQKIPGWPQWLADQYHRLLHQAGVRQTTQGGRTVLEPYNLLLLRWGMVVVPRRVEKIGGVSLNGLAYAGSLLAADEEQLQTILQYGPLRMLADAGFPPSATS